MLAPADPRTCRSLRRALTGGGAVTALLGLGLGGWAVTTEIAGAVVAPGTLVVETNVKKVQHPTGGVVGDLYVRDGSEVRSGEVLLRLDETVTRANLAVITKGQDELTARQARFKAEQDGRDRTRFPPELLDRQSEPGTAELLNEEERLFEIRRTAREGQKAQLKERIGQLREQMQGMADQVTAKEREISLIGDELKGVRELYAKNLIQITRMTALERDAARLEGERAALASLIAQTKGKMTETELQILQVDQDLRSEVGKELAEIRGKLAELAEKRIAAEDQLKRVEIRAPQDGVVHQLAIHTVGGVIGPGETLMVIVPRSDGLTVEARIQPQDIDQVRVGHRAVLRFTAFNQRTTPEISGEVSVVSADISQDQKTGVSFYTVRIRPAAAELERLKGLRLVPGMPVESFVQTGERTVISYLTKPLIDQINKAWRER